MYPSTKIHIRFSLNCHAWIIIQRVCEVAVALTTNQLKFPRILYPVFWNLSVHQHHHLHPHHSNVNVMNKWNLWKSNSQQNNEEKVMKVSCEYLNCYQKLSMLKIITTRQVGRLNYFHCLSFAYPWRSFLPFDSLFTDYFQLWWRCKGNRGWVTIISSQSNQVVGTSDGYLLPHCIPAISSSVWDAWCSSCRAFIPIGGSRLYFTALWCRVMALETPSSANTACQVWPVHQNIMETQSEDHNCYKMHFVKCG